MVCSVQKYFYLTVLFSFAYVLSAVTGCSQHGVLKTQAASPRLRGEHPPACIRPWATAAAALGSARPLRPLAPEH